MTTKTKGGRTTPPKSKGVVIYHVMKPREGFDDTADKLFIMVRDAQRTNPGAPRHLMLDIDGHRNELGGLDEEAWELYRHFIMEWLAPYLKTFTVADFGK